MFSNLKGLDTPPYFIKVGWNWPSHGQNSMSIDCQTMPGETIWKGSWGPRHKRCSLASFQMSLDGSYKKHDLGGGPIKRGEGEKFRGLRPLSELHFNKRFIIINYDKLKHLPCDIWNTNTIIITCPYQCVLLSSVFENTQSTEVI